MPTKISRYDNFYVFGGGLLGLYIASGLSDKINPMDQKLFLYDRGNTILSSWDFKIINSVCCNNGFHGIESPRARLITQFLGQLGCDKYFVEVPNHRILRIEDHYIAFTDSLSDWPTELTGGLNEILQKASCINLQDPDIVEIILSNTSIGSIIEKVYTRFADQIMDCWHLICPWFFPKEFLFPGSDEGSVFQNNVRQKSIFPKYVIPRANIFSDLRHIISERLSTFPLEIYLESKISLEGIVECCSQKNNLAIWCASSFGLLSSINPQLAQRSIASSRHMNLILFSVDKSSYDAWVNLFREIPTEILYLDTTIPQLNRVSFPQQAQLSYGEISSNVYILAECFTHTSILDNELISSIQDSLSIQFSTQVNLEGSSYGRPMFSFSRAYYPKAEQIVKSFADDNNLLIPNVYFGPINMAKCGIIGNNFLNYVL